MADKASVPYPIEIGCSHSNIDFTYGPYKSLAEAYSAMPIDEEGDTVRAIGLTVGIIENNSIKEYWFESGINQLVLKQSGGGGGSVSIISEITDDTKEKTDVAVSPKAVVAYVDTYIGKIVTDLSNI